MTVKVGVLSDFATRALMANKMRSFLTMLGIIIGVGAVILMLSIGNGTSQQVLSSINRLGSNLLIVMPGAAGQFGVRTATTNTLSIQDSNDIGQLPGVAAVSPEVRSGVLATYGDQSWTTTLTGSSPEIATISSLTIDQGRFFTQDDMTSIAPVAVIGQTVYTNLYPNGGNPVGTQIRIKGVEFTVIGLLNTIGASGAGGDQDDVIYMPVTTAMIRLLGITNQTISLLYVQVASSNEMTSVQSAMETLLRKNHRLAASAADDFRITNLAQIQATASSITGILTLFLAGVATISLIVGGIGIMNIMLVSVTERTREIGMRMALGASRQDILRQFLLEAVMLTMSGAAIGIILGIGGSRSFPSSRIIQLRLSYLPFCYRQVLPS